MSVERTNCPNCESRYEIAAVKFSITHETSVLFVCPSCGLALVEAPTASTSRAKLFGSAFALVAIIPVIFYLIAQLPVFEHQPARTGLATAVETTSGHLEQAHHLF